MPAEEHPDVTIVGEGAERAVSELLTAPGKDIWLYGGGELFRRFLEVGLVDTLEVAVVPVLLGSGIPVLPLPSKQVALELTGHQTYKTGIASVQYKVCK